MTPLGKKNKQTNKFCLPILRHVQPIFFFLIFFFFWLQIFENKSKMIFLILFFFLSFPFFFWQKKGQIYFYEMFVFLGLFLLPENKTKQKNPDRPTL